MKAVSRTLDGRKSALGQSRRFEAEPITSGLPLSTDIAKSDQLVRFGPLLTHAAQQKALLYHLIGACQEGGRDIECKRFRSLEVDD